MPVDPLHSCMINFLFILYDQQYPITIRTRIGNRTDSVYLVFWRLPASRSRGDEMLLCRDFLDVFLERLEEDCLGVGRWLLPTVRLLGLLLSVALSSLIESEALPVISRNILFHETWGTELMTVKFKLNLPFHHW